MPAFEVKIKSAEKLKAKVKRIVPEVEKALRQEILDAATEAQQQAIAKILSPKSGITYRRRNRSKQWLQWTASAPGEAPAKKTGERMARIKVKKWNRAGKPGAKILYPPIYRLLERGVGKLAPRPLFGPIISAYRNKFKSRLDDVVSKALGAVVRK
jgi:hypothetical protein